MNLCDKIRKLYDLPEPRKLNPKYLPRWKILSLFKNEEAPRIKHDPQLTTQLKHLYDKFDWESF